MCKSWIEYNWNYSKNNDTSLCKYLIEYNSSPNYSIDENASRCIYLMEYYSNNDVSIYM